MKKLLLTGIVAIVVGLTGNVAHAELLSSQELPKPDCRDLILKVRGAGTYWKSQFYTKNEKAAENMLRTAMHELGKYPECQKLVQEESQR
jgi:hypothetical protein